MLGDLHDMMAAWKTDCRGRQRRKEGEGSVGTPGDSIASCQGGSPGGCASGQLWMESEERANQIS